MILFFQVQYHEHYGSLIKMTVKKTGIGKNWRELQKIYKIIGFTKNTFQSLTLQICEIC